MNSAASAPPAGTMPGPVGGTFSGVATVREALGRFQTLIAVAIGISALVVVEDFLSWRGLLGDLTRIGPGPFSEVWPTVVQAGLAIALGIAIAILVIIAIVIAILGLVSWRRGVLAVVASAPEMGPAHVESCEVARQEHALTLWLFVAYVAAAIAIAAAFAIANATLSALGAGSIAAAATSVATGLATGSVLVAIYYYGARHLAGLLAAVASPTEASLLSRGRDRMVWGAVIGLVASLAPFFWVFDVAAVVSLGVILYGARDLVRSYDLWLAEHGPTRIPIPTIRPAGV